MRQLLLSTTTILMFSVTLTACGGGGGGGGGGGSSLDDTTEAFSVNAFKTEEADNPQNTVFDAETYDSLAAVSTAANDGTAIDITLQGLAVSLKNTGTYQREDDATWLVDGALNPKGLTINYGLTLSQITSSAVDLKFNADGTVTATTIYADADYTNNATVDRSKIFGFDSNYMAYINWSSNQAPSGLASDATTGTLIDIDAAMLAGVETEAKGILSAGKVDFKGAGKGSYGSLNANDALTAYNTTFTVIAEVDFAAGNVDVSTSNTICVGVCAGITVPNYLNFNTGKISYTSNTNLTLDGTLTGPFDARFYGGEAEEFGGIFALVDITANKERYYYGAFGTTRAGKAPFVASNSINNPTFNPLGVIDEFTATAVNIPADYDSLAKIATDAMAENTIDVTLHGLAVVKNDNTDYERRNTNIDWKNEANDAELKINREITLSRITAAEKSPAVKLTFGANGAISGVTVYADQDYANATADRSNIFGFASDYMAYISWNLAKDRDSLNNTTEDNIYNIDGIMLAGVETETGNIPTSDSAEFTGKGKGVYGSKTENYNTIFDVTANVNFAGRSLDLDIKNTQCTGDNCSNINDQNIWNGLNFDLAGDSALSFTNEADDGAINAIGADITLGNGQVGKLDARFYGNADGNFARELGGTFAFVNASNKNYYYGAFGAVRGEFIPFDTVKSTAVKSVNEIVAATPQPDGIATSGSLTAIKDTDATLQGLAVFANNEADYARETTETDWSETADIRITRTISISQIDNPLAAVTLTFEGNTASVKTAYVNSIYQSEGATLTVDRSTIFGFDSDYMAYISWHSQKTESELGNGINDSIYDRNGAMLAGIQTADGDIFKTSTVKFTGAGKGVYGVLDTNNALTRYNTTFTTNANVDFSARTVAFTTTNTACVREADASITCATDNITATNLDFSLTALSFADGDKAVNKITANNVILTGGLTGRLDARFYGGAAWEFGGTFALADATNKNYYYGAFGARRDGIQTLAFSNDELTTSLQDSGWNDYIDSFKTYNKSLKKASEDKKGENIAMDALVILNRNRTEYNRSSANQSWNDGDSEQNINLTRVLNSGATITFDENGNISRVEYIAASNNFHKFDNFNDDATNLTASGSGLKGDGFNDITDADTTLITVERGTSFFGFDSEYMIYAIVTSYHAGDFTATNKAIEEYKLDNDAIIFAGIQTADDHILTSGNNIFTGAGKGVYGVVDTDNVLTRYNTTFTTNATVDFSARTVAFTTTNTACTSEADVSVTCATDNITASNLDFSLTGLSFANDDNTAAVNKITADVTLDNSLTGKLDTRFYGAQAEEFGGTFFLTASDKRYYYGAFGGRRDNIVPFVVSEAETLHALEKALGAANPQTLDIGTYDSLTAIAEANAVTTATLQGLAVIVNDSTEYSRDMSDVAWTDTNNISINQQINTSRIASPLATVSLTFAADGTISSITANADADYAMGDDGLTITADRSSNLFGFASAYMVYVSWSLDKEADLTETNTTLTAGSFDKDGMMLAGIETTNNALASNTGVVGFEGKGKGVYGVLDSFGNFNAYDTVFTVTANVDFSDSTIALTTKHDLYSYLDFSVTGLSFAAGNTANKDVNIDVEIGGVPHSTLSGTVDARFYGSGATELGGTFALVAEDKEYYYGAFGAERGYSFVSETVAIDGITVPAETSNFTAFNNADRNGDTNNSFKLASAIQTTSNKADKIITNQTFTGAAVEFSYDAGGDFLADASNPLKFYFADKIYQAESGSGTDSLDGGTLSANGSNTAPSAFGLTRDFGFIANYMANVNWQVSADNVVGYGIFGFATANTNIPSTNADNATFTGEGQGQSYGSTDDGKRYFNVNANVNFNDKTINLASKNTCTDSDIASCVADNKRAHLDFSGDLTYLANTNNFTIEITTAGDDNNISLAGDATAKFYGTGTDIATELGGTFSLTNASTSYVGYFGAEKTLSVPFTEDATTTIGGLPAIANAYISGDNKSLVAHSAVVHSNRVVNYSRENATDSWGDGKLSEIKIETNNYHAATAPRIKINTDSAEKFGTVEVYFDDKKYKSSKNSGTQYKYYTNEINVATSTFGDSNDKDKGFKDNIIIADGRDSTVGYNNNIYLALIYWQLNENDPVIGSTGTSYSQQLSHGYGLVGTEATSDANVSFKSGSTTFNGKSIGSYSPQGEIATTKLTKSTIRAKINFNSNTGTLTSSGTVGRGANTGEIFSELDFTATIPDFEGKNKVGGTAQNTDNTLQGTIDARFYGGFTNHIAGTFELRGNIGDIPANYIGAFATRNY
ncbi:MAG: transferrin-binding protein-like solute binding protein [Alphaproteobacteria bacterium]|nr:transferrin-binding protein-like solute binding protein [Alphaproteobacteria bacterium]